MVPRRRLELLHLAATASKTVMSTIPSPGQICLDLPDSVMYPSSLRFGGMAPMCRPFGTRIFAHLPFHHLGKYVWCSRWDLNPHAHRAYASETYMSTIPSPEQSVFSGSICSRTCTPLECRTVSRMLALGSMAPNTSLCFVWIAHLPFHHPSR